MISGEFGCLSKARVYSWCFFGDDGEERTFTLVFQCSLYIYFSQEGWIFGGKILHPHNISQGPFFRLFVGTETLILLKANIDMRPQQAYHSDQTLFDFK